jgi:protein subunit release factor B
MITFSVSEEKNRWLRERMAALGIREEEFEEKFVRSAGKGGQHVNKSSTCVWLRHIPTGIEVKCMVERSQSINRFLARRELVEKIARQMGQPTHLGLKQEKERRQKARRRRRSAGKYRDGKHEEDGAK